MISVVIAAYRGEKYIEEQICSILNQLGEDDELIVSDDDPDAGTFDIVNRIMSNDNRVKYIKGLQKGLIKNFENAINHTIGDYIFLSDQDDVWIDGKVEAVVNEFKNGADVVMHNGYITNSELVPTGETVFESHNAQTGLIRNILKNSYQGSCMAFKSDFKNLILPFPDKIPMHDQWIGLQAERHGKVKLIDTPYIYYRRHNETMTGSQTSLIQKIKWRLNIVMCLLGK